MRDQICQARIALDQTSKTNAANQLCRIITGLPVFQQAQHIAMYWPYNAEINPLPILEAAIAQHKFCYLPVLHPDANDSLLFMPYHSNTTLKLNKFGIPEPDHDYQQAIALSKLAIILLPLVAFDGHGHRLGMGGGYYDATLAYVNELPQRPLCVGLGYAMQEVAAIPQDHWDFRLDAVATEQGYRGFLPHGNS